MYLHVPKVGPLIRDRHLARHNHLGNALSKRVDLCRRHVAALRSQGHTPHQRRLRMVGGGIEGEGGMSVGLCVLKVIHVGYAPCAAPLTSANASDSRFINSMYALSCSCLDRDANLVPRVRGCASRRERSRARAWSAAGCVTRHHVILSCGLL